MVAGVGTWGAVSAFRDIGAPQPGTSQADRRSYAQIAGTYSKTLTNEDPVVRANDMAGTYTMRLGRYGVMLLSVPPGFTAEDVSLRDQLPPVRRPVHDQRVREPDL